MNTTTPHAPPPDATAAYRPAAELVAGSAPLGADELVPLLRKRLRFLVLVFTAFYGVTAVLMRLLFPHTRTLTFDNWANAATLATLLGLLAVLSGRHQLTLRQLRAAEFVLFALFAARLVGRGYVLFWDMDHIDRVRAWIAAGDVVNARDMLFGIAHRMVANSAMFVVAYGVVVPNTWRRCAVVVAAFTVAPVIIWVVACIDRGLPADYWFTFGAVMAWWTLIQIAVMSVYGAYRIESSRQEAVEARRLGQYVLRERIGGGGMGEVYLADHVLLRRPCAVKRIRPERAGDPAMLQRFEREVRATATLTHPNAVQVFDYGHTPDGTFYYVMEFLPGPTLEELVTRDGPLPPERAIHFLRQLCGALAEAHAVGLIHRDIKPGNVIVCERGRVPDVAKLLDFGLVQSAALAESDDKLTQVGAVLGTPAFLAPEQASGEAADGRTDIYALGALAYFLLTGRPPFVEKSPVKLLAAHLHRVPDPPRSIRPDLTAELEAAVLRCLANKPDERFADVEELARIKSHPMPDPVDRRGFTAAFAASVVLGSEALSGAQPAVAPPPHGVRTEAPFERDYPPPGFNPSWKNPQINRTLVQDFVIFAHMDLGMVKKLLEKEPGLINAHVDWGAGDWESGLGGASHMGRHDIVEFLLEKGARIDIFCAAAMGQLDAVRAFLTLQPKLVDAKGPHGFTLHFHAQLARDGGKTLDYLQSVKKLELKPNPFLKKPADKADPPKKPQ